MAPLAETVNHSVAVVRRKLLQMMDALAESGMRQAHREIARAHDVPPLPESPRDDQGEPRGQGSAPVH